MQLLPPTSRLQVHKKNESIDRFVIPSILADDYWHKQYFINVSLSKRKLVTKIQKKNQNKINKKIDKDILTFIFLRPNVYIARQNKKSSDWLEN